MTRDADKENHVTALVDCDNTTPDVLEYATKVVTQVWRVVGATRLPRECFGRPETVR
jgi:hypothetical protein